MKKTNIILIMVLALITTCLRAEDDTQNKKFEEIGLTFFPTDEQPEISTPVKKTSTSLADAELITLITFDASVNPEPISGHIAGVKFERQTPGYINGKEFAPHVPRLVEGKFGKAIVLEEGRENFFTLNQSMAQMSSDNFIALKGAELSTSNEHAWQGSQSLKVKFSGKEEEQGFLAEAEVERAFYNGRHIVPSIYSGSFYAKGSGWIQLILKDPLTGETGEQLFFELSNEWKRFVCFFAFNFEPIDIGRNLENEWKSHLPEEIKPKAELQLICTTISNEQTELFADGFLLERRKHINRSYSIKTSPLEWIPGGTEVVSEKLSIATDNDFFNKWKQNGTISFWFKPNWDVYDATREIILHLGPSPFYLDHLNNVIRLTHANINFTPFDWQNEWTHIAIVWNEDGLNALYVDGFEHIGKNPFDNKTRFIAFNLGELAPNGTVDDLALFQTALTAEQINKLASGERPMQK